MIFFLFKIICLCGGEAKRRRQSGFRGKWRRKEGARAGLFHQEGVKSRYLKIIYATRKERGNGQVSQINSRMEMEVSLKYLKKLNVCT